MQKHIITLLCAVGVAISAPAFAKTKAKPKKAKAKISRSYTQQEHIPTVKLAPRVREVSSGYGIDAINVDFFRMFMRHPQVIPQMETQNAPRLIKGPDNRMMYGRGDRVYAYGIKEPGRYLVYRARKDILDPDTNKYLGQEVVFSGILNTVPYTNSALDARSEKDAEYLKEGEYYTRLHPLMKVPTKTAQPMVVEEAISEIKEGDYLLKIDESLQSLNREIKPHAPSQHIDARVVSIFDGVGEAGQFQTITLNKGEADGLDVGSVVSLYKRSRQVKMDFDEGKRGRQSVMKYVSIPSEEVGLAMVYKTSQNLSSAIILETLTNINIGDVASESGQDLDNMPNDKRHVKNAPQDSHDTEFNEYNYRSNINPY